MSKQNKKNRNTLRRVMAEANAMTALGLPRAVAMKKGWLVAKLAAILATGAMCNITFEKADGSIRPMKALPAQVGDPLIKGTGRHTPKSNYLVVDADLGEFRSFAKHRLLTVG